jgi:ParB-like chromosome segregation protein Spo0J
MPFPTLSVEVWAIERLIPYARNARLHSDQQVAQIAGSISEFGFLNPVLVDPEGGIVAGHGRVLAARKLGLIEVPVIVLGHLTKIQKQAFMLADNQLALNAGWDEAMLRLELAALTQSGFDVPLLGFDQQELDRLLTDLSRHTPVDPDEAPAVEQETVNEIGDLWELGKHRLLCGDGTHSDDLL